MVANSAATVARRRRAQILHGVYAIINDGERTLELARAVLDAGVGIVQYRAKRGIAAERLRLLRARTRESGALLILNDDWRAVLEFDCDGVHLGPDDAGFTQDGAVRAALDDRLIGLSCATIDEVRAAVANDADYLGVGSIYATQSKADAGEPIGIEGLRAIVAATPLPVAAVGGITVANAGAVRRAGAAMAAVIAAIAGASEPRRAAGELIEAWER